MKSFDTFWTELNSNPSWVEWMERINKAGFRKAAEAVYAEIIADQFGFDKTTIEECRKWVGNKLKKMPIDTRPFVPSVAETEKKEEPFLVGEARQKRIREVLAEIGKVSIPVPRLSEREIEEEGKWEKKHIPYPSMSASEVIKHERHLAWIKANFDPRTGEKLEGFVDEKDWIN